MNDHDCFISGKDIYLRGYQDGDIARWYKWFNDADTTLHMQKHRFPNTMEKQKEYLEAISRSSSDVQLAIVDKKNHVPVGTVGLHGIDLINRNAEISIIIGDPIYRGKGLGKQSVSLLIHHAFKTLNLHKVTAGANEENIASCKLFLSLGFTEEGRLREQIFVGGAYRAAIKFGLLRNEWKLPEHS